MTIARRRARTRTSAPPQTTNSMSQAFRLKRPYAGEDHGPEGTQSEQFAASYAALPMPSMPAASTKRSRRPGALVPSPTQQFQALVDGDSSWTKEDHRTLVQAIYEVGLRHSSPSVIQEHMVACDDEQVTGERLKSHLQKYRKNIAKNRDDFLSEYDDWLEKALAAGSIGGEPLCSDGKFLYLQPPMVAAKLTGTKALVGGEAAAFVTYSVMYEQTGATDPSEADESFPRQLQSVSIDLRSEANRGTSEVPDSTEFEPHQEFAFPILTEEERRSPLGMCLSRVMGLFQPMSLLLSSEREKNQALSVVLGLDDDLTIESGSIR